MREASKLLAEAGWKLQELTVDDEVCGFFCKIMRTVGLSARRKTENVLRNDEGETLTAEFLLDSPDFERIVLPYVQDLQKLGIKASVRMVDSAQYKRREDAHDFDIIVDNFAPVGVARQRAARFLGLGRRRPGRHRNTAGIKNPAIDKLIDKIVFAKDRADSSRRRARSTACCCGTTTWCRSGTIRSSGSPTGTCSAGRQTLPSQTAALTQVWWIDPEKQKALDAARGTVMVARRQMPPRTAARQAHRPRSPRVAIRRSAARAARGRRTAPRLSVFGDLKYPADFKHFDYVNPDAPKGGRLSTIGTGGAHDLRQLQQLHPQGRRGAGARVSVRQPDDARAATSPTPSTGWSPAAAEVAPDRMSVTFKLRPEAKFADGSPVTADDVVFTFDTLKEKGHPNFTLVAARRRARRRRSTRTPCATPSRAI